MINQVSNILNTQTKNTPDIGGDIAGDSPGMAGDRPGDTPIMDCDEPTPGSKVGSYEGNAILFIVSPSLYL